VSDLRVVLAPNPGIMTGPGTNQYLLGGEAPVLIDAAAWDDENARRLDEAHPGRLGQILLTHIHPDHVGGVLPLAEAHGAPVAVHRSRAGYHHGGRPLAPARLLDDGDEIRHPAGRLRVVHTPGHESGHCCYYDPDRRWLFTGDTVLGTGTVVIPPPDGDMAAYLASLRRLRALDLALILPGHGQAIERPHERIDEYITHRLMRERQVVEALEDGLETIPAIVARLYAEVPAVLHGAAGLTVRAHLQKLIADGVVVEELPDRYRRAR
jgi:glyoxylase-like metal-dependent hydrolase (beta-lactamase superfamily II)